MTKKGERELSSAWLGVCGSRAASWEIGARIPGTRSAEDPQQQERCSWQNECRATHHYAGVCFPSADTRTRDPPDRFDSLLPSLSLLFINYSSTVEARISVSRELKCQATGAKRSAKNGSKQPVVSRVFTQSCWEQKVEARGRNSPSAPCVGDRRQATRTVARMPAAGVQARQARVGQPTLETQAAHEAEREREKDRQKTMTHRLASKASGERTAKSR